LTKIVLHIGGEKTGTTSIQAAMAKNARLLFAKFRLLYPITGPFFDDNAHFPLAAAFLDAAKCDFLDGRLRREPAELHRALDRLIARNRPRALVFSAEHFSSRFGPAQLTELARFLAPHPVEVIFYVRPQDELALSAFGTGLQCGRRQWFDVDAIGEEDRYFNHCQVADDWAAVFGANNLRVRSYADLAVSGLLSDFLAELGVGEISGLETVPRLNETINDVEARLLFSLNPHLPDWGEAFSVGEPEKYRAAQRLRVMLLAILRRRVALSGAKPLSTLLGQGDRARFMARFAESNRRLAERYGVAISSRGGWAAEAAEAGNTGPEPSVLLALLHTILRNYVWKDEIVERLYRQTSEVWIKSIPQFLRSGVGRVPR
jgi:hypothetical protein